MNFPTSYFDGSLDASRESREKDAPRLWPPHRPNRSDGSFPFEHNCTSRVLLADRLPLRASATRAILVTTTP